MIDGYLVGDREAVARFTISARTAGATGQARHPVLAFCPCRSGCRRPSYQIRFCNAHWQAAPFDHSRVEEDGARVHGFIGTNVVQRAASRDGIFRNGKRQGALSPDDGGLWAKGQGPRQISVRAFSRQIKYAARPFLRPALAEMKLEIVKGMEQALRDAAKVAFT